MIFTGLEKLTRLRRNCVYPERLFHLGLGNSMSIYRARKERETDRDRERQREREISVHRTCSQPLKGEENVQIKKYPKQTP